MVWFADEYDDTLSPAKEKTYSQKGLVSSYEEGRYTASIANNYHFVVNIRAVASSSGTVHTASMAFSDSILCETRNNIL